MAKSEKHSFISRLKNPYYWGIAIAIGLLEIVLLYLTSYLFGFESPRLVANGMVSVSLGVFLLTLIVFYSTSEPRQSFLEKGAIRTAIAIAFTVAYLMLFAYSLIAGELRINLDNKVVENFYLVYISIIAFYFGTTGLEKMAEIKKGK